MLFSVLIVLLLFSACLGDVEDVYDRTIKGPHIGAATE